MEDDPFQLRDLVPADPLLREPGLPWWAWALLVVGGLLLILLAVALFRRGGAPPARPGPDPEAAFREASEALDRAAGLPSREAATASSEAIRRYLATVCGDPSLFETHEEFLARHHALDDFPAEVREHVSTLFCRLAALKYDKDRSGSTPEMIEGSLFVLRQLHQQRPA